MNKWFPPEGHEIPRSVFSKSHIHLSWPLLSLAATVTALQYKELKTTYLKALETNQKRGWKARTASESTFWVKCKPANFGNKKSGEPLIRSTSWNTPETPTSAELSLRRSGRCFWKRTRWNKPINPGALQCLKPQLKPQRQALGFRPSVVFSTDFMTRIRRSEKTHGRQEP